MDTAAVTKIAPAILAMRESREVVLVAIDGAGGAGKSTLAKALAGRTGASIVEGDDFYRVLDEEERLRLDAAGGCAKYIDWQRLRDQVLEPLRRGAPCSYERYDWSTNTLTGRASIDYPGVIVIEGVYSFRPELRHYFDFSILVQAPRAERFERLRARGQNSEDWIQRWDAAEQWYFENQLSPKDVDVVVSGAGEG